MNPVTYFDFKECDNDSNSVVITKDKLKEIINEAYQTGYTDGIKYNYRITVDVPKNREGDLKRFNTYWDYCKIDSKTGR